MGKIRKLLGQKQEKPPACKFCGTYLVEEGDLPTCPQCGYVAARGSYVFNLTGKEEGRPQPEEDLPPAAPGSLSNKSEKSEAPSVAVELVDEAGEDLEVEAEEKLEPEPSGFSLNPAALRELLAKQPGLLEPGLGLATDQKGQLIRAGFSTAVGSIDLLARDKSGTFVVVMVPDTGDEAGVMPGILQRIGWVRKHLGQGKRPVRGIILLERPPEAPDYSAAAVAGMVAFKTYRVAVSFEDVEV